MDKTKEEILNECRGEFGAQYDPAYWKAALKAMDIYADHYKNALKKIANPIGYLREEAEKEGAKLNGNAAQIANDPNFLKKIAADALEIDY